ncbi:hypothetical protein [uncultured Desulfosarcina sp.]|uniref:hypothetical protein n=1 Tax=uncultured Desulfosarcina sp. TaxID=218289 RepID=UPI0029C62A7F|nr:hypothetical protein [uncultured Desulfosarcina sp.]
MFPIRFKDISLIDTWLRILLVSTFAALVFGCASTARETKSNASYEIGKETAAKIGTPMLIREEGTVEKKRRWVGLLNSPDGWETIGTEYSDDYKRMELIYRGGSGTKINVTYRVFRAGSVVPEQSEDLAFDLSESGTIVVQSFRIKVLQADESSIDYIVLNY